MQKTALYVCFCIHDFISTSLKVASMLMVTGMENDDKSFVSTQKSNKNMQIYVLFNFV